MDLTVPVPSLTAATAEAVRLLPGSGHPVLSGLLLEADEHGLVLSGNDHEQAFRLACSALTHTDGTVLVPARPLAETLKALDDPQVRLVVEGSRLAVRTPSARFALPLLDRDLHPGGGGLPPLVGEVAAEPLALALRTVAGTASRDDSLPMFTGVRVRAGANVLHLLASDRFRMAAADLPYSGGELDVLVPAGLLGEIGRQVGGQVGGRVGLHADGNRFGLSWGRSAVTTAVLDAGFLAETAISTKAVDTTLTLDADALAAAVRRTSIYSGPRGVVALEVGDSTLRVAGTDPRAGEAEETVKSTEDGGRTSPSYQARYLLDALRPFAGTQVRLAVQPGMRATVLTAAEPEEVALRYYVMPMQPPK